MKNTCDDPLEDRWSISKLKNGILCSIFDGSDGVVGAEISMRYMHNDISNAIETFACNNDDPHVQSYLALTYAFMRAGSKIAELQKKYGVLKGDPYYSKPLLRIGFTAALTAYIRDSYLYIANAGNCRAILCSGKEARLASKGHIPASEEEQKRLKNIIGGNFYCDENAIFPKCGGGYITISRGFGCPIEFSDAVIYDPEIYSIQLNDQDTFLLLASSGVFKAIRRNFLNHNKKLSNDQINNIANNYACRIVSEFLEKHPNDVTGAANELCKKIRELKCGYSGRDLTVIIVLLKNGNIVEC